MKRRLTIRLLQAALLLSLFLLLGCVAGDGDSSDDVPSGGGNSNNDSGSNSGGSADGLTNNGTAAGNPTDSSSSFTPAQELDNFIESEMSSGHIPGLSIAIVKGSEVVYTKGYGVADTSSGIAVSPDTIFLLASVSKAVTGVGLMQLIEHGGADLDDDINGSLPFEIRNPNFPDTPITIRQLLAHVSGVQDDVDLLNSLSVDGDATVTLADFVRGYFVPGGAYFNLAHNWLTRAPGTKYQFTDAAIALAGFLGETLSGLPFSDYARRAIFVPLGMTHTSFTLAGLGGSANLATPYHFNGQNFIPFNQYGFPDYPDGLLRSSARDLSRFLIALMNGGSFEGAQILTSGSVSEIERLQFPQINRNQGLVMYYKFSGATELFGHGGEHQGASAEMFYSPTSNVGVILLANVDGASNSLLNIEQRMLDLAGN